MKSENKEAPRSGKSLSRRFGITLVIVVTAILILFSAVVGWYNYAGKEAELQRQLGQALRLAETSLPEAVWKLDHRSINDILRAILSNDAVVYVRVLVDDQLVANQVRPEYEGENLDQFGDASSFIVSSAAIRRDGNQVGSLQVVMSKNAIYKELVSTTAGVVGLLLLLIIAILVTSMLILRHFIFRPLAMLEKSAKRIAEGHLETQITIDADDEIGSLASTLRIMTRRLQESFEQLEQKVRERTADLTEAKLAAEETSHHLSVVGAELQALLDNSPVGIVFVDSKGLIKRANQEMMNITGYGSDELIGYTPRLHHASDEAYKKMTEKVQPLLKRWGYCAIQAVLKRKDGAEIICQLHGRVVAAEGGLKGVVWSVEDISNRIRMENELLKTKKQESISVLAGGIAHDFNNILFAVMGNISLAERLAEESSPIRDYLQAAHEASIRAKELTVKLLNFAVGAEPVKATVSLPELVRNAVELVCSASHNKIQCNFEIPEDLWAVSMDKEQISQVITALMQNAEQSMSGGGTVIISLANKELVNDQKVGLNPGKYVKICLADEGRGIEAQYLDKIFDPYFSTKEKDSKKGAGLGLAIVHSIINKHEGRITVESTPGRGTTFTLYLPALPTDGGKAPNRTTILPSGKGRVLVLDDDIAGRDVVCDMLIHIGYSPQPVNDGPAAMQVYREALEGGNPFVAVVKDPAVPGSMEWVAMVAGFREIDPQVKIIAACADDSVLQDFAASGFCNTITKPYQLLELNRVMVEVSGK
ncbi:MAG: PAS domain S-box protein [Proteobacteria bacterium]|nr:PAS domain S-box protein [Pseudomonadota bacterium]